MGTDEWYKVQTSDSNSMHESSESRESSIFLFEMNYESLIFGV